MANITHARSFNGTSDKIKTAAGSLTAFGTIVLLLRRQTGDSGTFRTFFAVHEGPSADGFYFHDDSNIQFGSGGATTHGGATFPTVAEEWVLLAFGKATGTSLPRFHKYVYGSTTWTHVDGAASLVNWVVDDPAFGSGHASGGEFASMYLAAAAMYGSALSDANLETMTATIASWDALSPTTRWLFNQTSVSTAVEDSVGTADETSRVGTTVVSVSDLAFDVGAAPVRFDYSKFPKSMMRSR